MVSDKGFKGNEENHVQSPPVNPVRLFYRLRASNEHGVPRWMQW